MRNIGDVLLATPALRVLRENYPDAHITVIVNSGTEAMLDGNPHIDRLLVYDRDIKKASFAKRLKYEFGFLKEIIKSRFDMVVDYTATDRPAWYSLLSRAQVRLAYRQRSTRSLIRRHAYTNVFWIPRSEAQHEVERHLWLLKMASLHTKETSLCMAPNGGADAWAENLLASHSMVSGKGKKIVHVHPVSRWLFKCWPNENMSAVMDWLALERSASVIMTCSGIPEEMERAQAIWEKCKSKPLFLGGNTTLQQVSALSRRADCFFGVDTAPMHMAAAVGTPVVALFGPTGYKNWQPWCKQREVLHKPCACNQSGGKPVSDICDWQSTRDCMNKITVEEAKAALTRFI